jgi:hypothetical protein
MLRSSPSTLHPGWLPGDVAGGRSEKTAQLY